MCRVDVRAIGPLESSVGLGGFNGSIHKLFGVHMVLYTVTDWLGLVPIFIAFCFGALGLFQWIKRGALRKVDFSLFVLGGFYIVVIFLFLFFEKAVINYRPVLINGILEASYPSSTTLLVSCVFPTAEMQLRHRFAKSVKSRFVSVLLYALLAFMVIARLVSGVHWASDIVGGLALSAGLVSIYAAIAHKKG